MYDSKEISKISKNLSLRLSPERKYGPEVTSCPRCYCSPCKCCYHCHCCPCTCFLHSPTRHRNCSPFGNDSALNSLKDKYSPKSFDLMGSTNYGTNQSPKRPINTFIENYNAYEKGQFNDFLKELMSIENEIERVKIDLSINPDFNCEDAFRMFELDGRDFLDKDDLKYGLNLLNLYPTDHELRLLIKRFDLQKQGVITYADFFDIIVPFEKENRILVEERLPRSCCSCRSIDAFSFGTINALKNLFNLIINAENQINNMRRSMGTLRIKLRDIFGLIDSMKRGYFNNGDLLVYLQKEGILVDDKDVDLLFIRLDKNRNGKIDYREVEDELQTLY